MIDRQKGRLFFECDGCGEVQEFENCRFEEAWATLRETGWRARKVDEVWTHGCERCGTKL